MGGWLDLLRGVMGEQCGRTEGIMDGMTRWDVGSRRKELVRCRCVPFAYPFFSDFWGPHHSRYAYTRRPHSASVESPTLIARSAIP